MSVTYDAAGRSLAALRHHSNSAYSGGKPPSVGSRHQWEAAIRYRGGGVSGEETAEMPNGRKK